jgi:hypothetical protein
MLMMMMMHDGYGRGNCMDCEQNHEVDNDCCTYML